MISYNKISSNNIEKGIKLYTIIKWVISFILVASIVLCLVAIFFCSENITLEIISYVAVILSIVIVYILPVGKIKIQMDTVDDYKKVLSYLSKIEPKICKQYYLTGIYIIKRSVEDFEHEYFKRLEYSQIDDYEQKIRNNISMFIKEINEDKDKNGMAKKFYCVGYVKKTASNLLNELNGYPTSEIDGTLSENSYPTSEIDGTLSENSIKGHLFNPRIICGFVLGALIIFKIIVIAGKHPELIEMPLINLFYNTIADIIALILLIKEEFEKK